MKDFANLFHHYNDNISELREHSKSANPNMTNSISTLCGESSLCQDIFNPSGQSGYDDDIDDIDEITEIEQTDDMFGIMEQPPKKKRRKRWLHLRLDWALHVRKLQHERMFDITYGMPLVAFENLIEIVKPKVLRETGRSRCPQPVSVEIITAAAIRYLRGGRVLDIKDIFGLSRTEVYASRDSFLNAVLQCDELKVKMPTKPEEWESIRTGFQSKSSNGLVHGCVGVLDGFLAETYAPKKKDVGGNVLAYFSGHYLVYGLNCQAMCDSNLKFMYFGVVAPGRTNDNVAIHRTEGLLDVINSLPDGLFVIGDAAYTLMEHLLIPFVGCMAEDPDRDAYNFYISQLRIRIEMAFGKLVKKFGILRSKLMCGVRTTTRILMTCACLHNYIIDWSQKMGSNEVISSHTSQNDSEDGELSVRVGPNGMEYLPTMPESFIEIPGHSQNRQYLLDTIKANKIRRPNYNIERNLDRVSERSYGDVSPEYFQPR